LHQEILAAVENVLKTQQFRGGNAVESFEQAIAAYTGTKHALGVASGTDALYLLFRALDLEPGNEIITTPWTFFATAGAIVNAGARPVFVDIDPHTFCIDPQQIEDRITPRTRAILAVHLYGQCANMEAITHVAARHGVPVFEDAAQALGARQNGVAACALSQGGALSFYPTKNLGAAGEGGMIATNSNALADRIRLLRCHGAPKTYFHEVVGVNSHLHGMQAAVLHVKLKYLDEWTAARRRVAARYDEALRGLDGVVTPSIATGNEHVYHQYVIRIVNRDAAKEFLQSRGVGCAVFYPLPLHMQPCFASLGYLPEDFPEALRASAEVLALPIYPELTEAQQDEVIGALKDFVKH
jgi:dTDP-4-amino-4,6-dideoxygalactose transaminase